MAREMEEFLTFKRSLGYGYVRAEFTLRAFGRFLAHEGRRPMILRAIVAQLLWSGGCPLDRKEMNVSSDRPIRQSDPASDIKPQVADL